MEKDTNAIGIVRQMVTDGQVSQEVAERYFPELKESEDEKIRKELLEHCINRRDGKQVCVDASDYRRWADWLFRQGVENIPNLKSDKEISNEIIKFLELPHPQFVGKRHQEECITWLEKQGYKDEEILVLKDQIESLHAAIRALKEAHKIEFKKQGEQKPAWSEEDKKILKDIITDVKFEGYNNDMQANSYKKINWLKSLKDRVQPQPKQEWSKEDEKMFDYALDMIEWYSGKNEGKSRLVSDWLKSLRP